MSELFLKIFNMSVSASWLVLAVLLVRVLLKKAPKWTVVLLWGVVAVRLICPFTVESVMSLIPSAETVSPQALVEEPAINTGVAFLNNALNPVIRDTAIAVAPEKSVNVLQLLVLVFSKVWLIGIGVMLLYTVASYLRLKRKVRTAVLLQDRVFQSENVISPFVLGILKPRIYLPFAISEEAAKHVIAHENAHIRRGDHLWKPLGFLILTLHWFNPLVWLGYVLLCRDIELACDEKVIKEMDADQKADYSQALLACSVNRRLIAACPLAFGEVGVKARVRSVLYYKKPAFWIVVAALLACIAVALCFLTNPKTTLDGDLSLFVDMQIVEHNADKPEGEGIFSAVHHKVLGIKRSLNQTTVYLWAMYQEYSCENGEIKEESGGRSPVVITAKRTGKHGHYELVEYWQPRDGSYYVKDIRAKFPWYLHGKAIDSQRYVREQEEFCRKAAEESFADSIAQVGGADAPAVRGAYVDGHPFVFVEVLEIYENSLRAKVIKDSKWIKKGTECVVSTKIINKEVPLPKFEVGNSFAIVFDGAVQETYPVQINTVYAIYHATNLYPGSTFPFDSESPVVSTLPVLTEAPAMSVISNEQSVVAMPGASTWVYAKENGEIVSVCGDPVHPETAKKMMPCIDLLPTYLSSVDPLGAYLYFYAKETGPSVSVPPDELHILCYEEETWGKAEAQVKEIELNEVEGNLFFRLKEGNYVYEVRAQWKNGENISGTVVYTFRTAKSDMIRYPIVDSKRGIKERIERTPADRIEKMNAEEKLVITETHSQMEDGLWAWNGHGYYYRLEITGRMNNSEKNISFVVLSNRKDITFDRVWKASGFSSSTEDYFKPTDAVIVGYRCFD